MNVGYNEIGKAQALNLVSIFKQKDQMKSVGLEGCNLGVDGAKAVADYVSISAVLTSINLSSNQLCGFNWNDEGIYTAEGITAIADALHVNSALTELNLSLNRIGAEGAKPLADALCVNSSLTEVRLSDFERVLSMLSCSDPCLLCVGKPPRQPALWGLENGRARKESLRCPERHLH